MSQMVWLNDLIATNKIVVVNGGIHMNNDNKQYNTVNGVQGSAFSFGPNSTNTVNNNQNSDLVDLTRQLIEILKSQEIPTEQKQELEEVITAAAEEATKETPKKAILKSLLASVNSIMDTINKTPALITAYEKWDKFIQGFNPPPV